MDNKILEDKAKLAEFRATELLKSRTSSNAEKKLKHLSNYLVSLPVHQRFECFQQLSSKELDLIISRDPLMLRTECVRNLNYFSYLEGYLDRSNPFHDLFLLTFDTSSDAKSRAFKAVSLANSLDAYLFFTDIFSEPANGAEAVIRDRSANKRLILYAIKQNAARANKKTIEKLYRKLKAQRRTDIEIITQVLLALKALPAQSKLTEMVSKDLNAKIQNITFEDPSQEVIERCLEQRNVSKVIEALGMKTIEELFDYACAHISPDLFNHLMKILHREQRVEAAHSLCLGRLKAYPNSAAASTALLNIFYKSRKPFLAMKLADRLSATLPYNEKLEYQRRFYRASLGDWSELSKYIKNYLAVRKYLRSDRPIKALQFMFSIDACPDVSANEKYSVYEDFLEAKNIRDLHTPSLRLENKKISLIGGDFRRHAMAPILTSVASTLSNLADVHVVSTCSEDLDDAVTKHFKDSYDFSRLPLDSSQDDARAIVSSSSMCVDVAQHTEFNALKYFRRGLNSVQLSSYWASGFLVNEGCFDYHLVDKYSFYNIEKVISIPAGKLIPLRSAQVFPPTQIFQRTATKRRGVFVAGVFVRPFRYSRQLFESISALISLGLVDSVLFSHPHLMDRDSKNYLKDLLLSHSIDTDAVRISSASLSEALETVDIAIDSHPVGSPTTTRDLLFAGVPVFVMEGSDVFSRLSPAFFHYCNLPSFMAKNKDDLLRKVLDFKNISVTNWSIPDESYLRATDEFRESLLEHVGRILDEKR